MYNPAAIKMLREAMGLSQAKFAKRLGITRQQQHQIESGDHMPNVSTLNKIIKEFGVDPKIFFYQDRECMHIHDNDRAA